MPTVSDSPPDVPAQDMSAGDMGEAPGDMALVPDMPVVPPRCEALPRSCDGLDPGATEHYLKPIGQGCAFALRPPTLESITSARALADQLAAQGRGRVALDQLDLNRVAQPGVTANAADRLKNHDHFGFRWNAGDMSTPDWYPQGITGRSDASAQGGRRHLLVSWYDHKDDATVKGVRVSVVDLSDADTIRYRHILLVVPSASGGQVSFGPVVTGSGGPLHAGGIVWFGDLLYVADTTQGFRVFDLSRIIEVTHTDDTERVGVSGARMDAFGYRYIAPQIARYTLHPSACPLRFSFVSLDRSAQPPVLMSGEYRADDAGGRLATWPLDAQTGWLAAEPDGTVRATSAYVGAQTRIQGAMSWQGSVYMSCSSQYNGFGRLYRTRLGQQSAISAWVRGAEDLYHERDTSRVWTAAEHPDLRDVVSIPRQNP